MSNQEKEYNLARWILSIAIPAQEQVEDTTDLKAYELRINARPSNPATSSNKNTRCCSCFKSCTQSGHNDYQDIESDHESETAA